MLLVASVTASECEQQVSSLKSPFVQHLAASVPFPDVVIGAVSGSRVLYPNFLLDS